MASQNVIYVKGILIIKTPGVHMLRRTFASILIVVLFVSLIQKALAGMSRSNKWVQAVVNCDDAIMGIKEDRTLYRGSSRPTCQVRRVHYFL